MPALLDESSPTLSLPLSDEERREKKRLKKEGKRKVREEKEAAVLDLPIAINDQSPMSETASEEKELSEEDKVAAAERKAAKKAAKRKRKEEESAASTHGNINHNQDKQTTEITSVTDDKDNNQDQKQKKQKKCINTSSSSTHTPITESEAVAYRTEHSINITKSDSDIFPIISFSQLPLPSSLTSCLSSFSVPTPIQAQCWPVLLSGRDIVAIAETGSGKTLGFTLPGVNHILNTHMNNKNTNTNNNSTSNKLNNSNNGPYMLVLSPTRELATQTKDVIVNATSSLPQLRTAVIYGGVDKYAQKQAIRDTIQILVACPGRLLSLLDEGHLSLSSVSFIVLDEADRMLDMGFEPDIRRIFTYCTKTNTPRQTCMFSATWPTSVERLASEFINNPVSVTIGAIDLKANHRVTQTIEVFEPPNDNMKQQRLLSLLNIHHKNRVDRVIIFVLYKKEVDIIERFLLRNQWKCIGISGDRTQQQRSQAIEDFKSGTIPILVATDVAARGLDIPNVQCVINYTFPLTVEDYVHRIGRTGRGGKTGISITFFSKNEKHLSGELINVLREANEKVPEDLLKFGTAVKKKEHGMYGAFYKADDEISTKKSVKVKF